MKVLPLFGLLFAISYGACNSKEHGSGNGNDSLPVFANYIRDSTACIDSLEVDFYFPVKADLHFTNTRPLHSDSTVLFVCAAAFTRLDNGRIDGLSIIDGTINTRPVNHTLGGGVIFPADSGLPVIIGTDMGKKLDTAFVDSLCALHASFFQQIQMVRDGQPLVFKKDVSLFQRRALAVYHGVPVIIESKEKCTLQKFAEVLNHCGIRDAVYLDMGSWDEGWFRDEHHAIHTIGLMRNQTDRQSNWLYFKSR